MGYDELKGKAVQAPLFMSDLFLGRSAPTVIRYVFKAPSGNLSFPILQILYGVVYLNCYAFLLEVHLYSIYSAQTQKNKHGKKCSQELRTL